MSREVDIPSHVAMASLPLPAASELVVCPCGVSFLLRRWCALSHPRLHLQPCNPATLAFSHAAHRPAPCTPFPIPDPVLLHIGTMQYPVFPCCHARSVHIRPFVRSFPRLAPPPPPPRSLPGVSRFGPSAPPTALPLGFALSVLADDLDLAWCFHSGFQNRNFPCIRDSRSGGQGPGFCSPAAKIIKKVPKTEPSPSPWSLRPLRTPNFPLSSRSFPAPNALDHHRLAGRRVQKPSQPAPFSRLCITQPSYSDSAERAELRHTR